MIKIRTENNNNISASSSQVGIVRACWPTLSKAGALSLLYSLSWDAEACSQTLAMISSAITWSTLLL